MSSRTHHVFTEPNIAQTGVTAGMCWQYMFLQFINEPYRCTMIRVIWIEQQTEADIPLE